MMNLNDITGYFAIYWLIAGIAYCWYFVNVIMHEEDFEDLVRDIRWNTGIEDFYIIFLASLISLVFGFYFLPKQILKDLGVIGEKDK